MLTTERSYTIETGPAAMSWDEYARLVAAEWAELLNSAHCSHETNIQRFLEKHPCLVPGGQSMSGPSGHMAYPAALITQPRLPGYEAYVPDFLWIAADSLHLYAVLIEIESPSKRMFRKDGQPTAEFTQAQTQLLQWKSWLSEPANQLIFRNHFRPVDEHPWRKLKPQYVLIYGRRSEFETKPELGRLRAGLAREDEFYMSFDRLRPNKDHDQYMTVRFEQNRFQAVSMPATLEMGPVFADYRLPIQNKEMVVDETEFMSEERKQFIKRRLSYWDNWSRQGAKGMINLGDIE
ncbi:Shedu anti-phage system protein SduA domain-containing protein [Agrobacterium tumefaciens]|uniref:Shedu protein SduA C-terminal domain-containing protein n=1 Tax=Agrobacterium tumefaciens TaxID=358 RepID=A0A2L2LMT4_AGRTU|nr:Shedu anti-phage system protein SduA domain-containing protein [Agrobacterium tumefaciens]AVH45538.1 hypothetical protein At1D1609_55070 [Agrobacterium tumefaciens]NSY99336.1 DUF4263 domain-containing protein [Agrobacterium tumefaciens]